MKPLYRFRSDDGRFGVALPVEAVRRMLAEARAAGGSETGGILVGLYNEALDTAIVTQAETPPPDSTGTRSSFLRGVAGVRERLGQLWKRPVRTYYLGEWHVHPGFSPEKSADDDATMLRGGLREAFNCAVPILVILGGEPTAEWSLRAWAYPRDGAPVRLRGKGEV